MMLRSKKRYGKLKKQSKGWRWMEGVGVLKGFELRRGSQMPGEGVPPRLQPRGRVSEERLVPLECGQEAGGTGAGSRFHPGWPHGPLREKPHVARGPALSAPGTDFSLQLCCKKSEVLRTVRLPTLSHHRREVSLGTGR